MCFSPQADVAGGLVICAIGIDAVRHAGPCAGLLIAVLYVVAVCGTLLMPGCRTVVIFALSTSLPSSSLPGSLFLGSLLCTAASPNPILNAPGPAG
jgi:hypothetical protein